MNYVQYEHPIESEVVELEEDIGADSLVDVDQVDGVLETPGNYEFVRIKEGPQFHDVGRKYRMIRRQPAKTFFCHQCNKEIKYPSKIAEHLRKHTGEKPYLCHICGVSFSQGHVLKVHLRGHHGERPYKCSYCVKAFTGLSQKKSHEKTHFMSVGGISCLKDDDQPINSTSNMTTVRHVFACPIMSCGMQSEQKREVEDHITLMHSDVQEWVEEEYTHDTYDSHMNAPIGDSAEEQQYDYYPFEGGMIIGIENTWSLITQESSKKFSLILEVVIEEKPETSHLNGDASNPLSMDAHDTDQQNHSEEACAPFIYCLRYP
uniref:C2H2-type domain-containing protein n=1 Tax=Heterorhabditis bacteriophora TaxID=37862 RepID=A0A1I7X1L2_HETBA